MEEPTNEGEAGGDLPLVLRLSLDAGEPVSGTLGIEGRPGITRFTGWVELMAAVTDARDRGTEVEGPP